MRLLWTFWLRIGKSSSIEYESNIQVLYQFNQVHLTGAYGENKHMIATLERIFSLQMTDRDKVFQVQAEALIVSLTQLLEEKELMTVETLDDFLAAFAVVFPEYLHATSQKFSPESIAAGAVSCAGAALLLGI